jgi:hypothetical protein
VHIGWRVVLIGCALGLAALGLFATLHAIVIKPVWRELAGGIPFVIAIGVSVTWAYHEFAKAAPKRLCSTGGLRFGALMWLSAWPATALASWMRVKTGGALPDWVDYAAVALSLAGGALAMWSVTRGGNRRLAALSGAVAATVLLAAGGGPLPVIRGGRVLELWLGLFILETISGAILAQMYKHWGAPPAVTAPVTPG